MLPLNPAFKAVIGASDSDRRDLFLGTAARTGTAVQNVEKDFWVCWTLDALFNGLPAGGPRLLFKGGTSLSKAFRLVTRFSEDIDITVFRDDLGHAVEAAELDALSSKKRRARLDAIRTACQAYIRGPLREQFAGISTSVIPDGRFRLDLDPEDNRNGRPTASWPSTARTTLGCSSAVRISDSIQPCQERSHCHPARPCERHSHGTTTRWPGWSLAKSPPLMQCLPACNGSSKSPTRPSRKPRTPASPPRPPHCSRYPWSVLAPHRLRGRQRRWAILRFAFPSPAGTGPLSHWSNVGTGCHPPSPPPSQHRKPLP